MSLRSITRAGSPASSSSRAHARPAIPAPTTTTVMPENLRRRDLSHARGRLFPMLHRRRPPVRLTLALVSVLFAVAVLGLGLLRAAIYSPAAVEDSRWSA